MQEEGVVRDEEGEEEEGLVIQIAPSCSFFLSVSPSSTA